MKRQQVGPPSWRRIPAGLRYLRSRGLVATWHRIFPRSLGYGTWIKAYDTLRRRDIRAIKTDIQKLSKRPLLSVILLAIEDHEPLLRDAVLSVTAQLYPDWELCIVAPPEALAADLDCLLGDRRIKLVPTGAGDGFASAANAALTTATGDFVLLLRVQDQLAAHALYMIAAELSRNESANLIYSDEDFIDERGRRGRPSFKTDWNPDLFLGGNPIGHLAAYRRSLVAELGGFRSGYPGVEEYDLLLRLTKRTQPTRIRHLPTILYHRREAHDAAKPGLAEGLRRAVTGHLSGSGCAASTVSVSQCNIRVRHPLPLPLPGVSLIIPTRDRLNLLQRCIDGLLSKTDYDNLELIIVDNDSELAETDAYLARLNELETVRVLKFSGQFNFSAINNFAANHARHDILGFINNDIEVIHADWLREMVSQAIRPEIGAVGAKLLYPDNTIQHAGTIVGFGGLAGHAFRHFDRADPGYLNRLRLVQNISAVTAACLVMRKQIFDEVGGFDAVNLPVAYNDVDLCLRVRERGYLNLWTPFAELYHHESGSRPSDFSDERIESYNRERNYLKRRWSDVIRHDPFYNPNLTIDAEDFGLAFPPRSVRPWRR